MNALRWLKITLLVIGVSAVGVYVVALSRQYQPILTGIGQSLAWIGVGGIIGGLALSFNIFKHLSETKEKRRARLRKHAKIFNDDVYKKLLHIFVEPTGSYGRKRQLLIPADEQEYRRYQLELIVHPLMVNEIRRPYLIPLSRIESLELGISHLKHPDYKEIYNAWTKLDSLIKEYNGLVASLDEELTQTVKKKMLDKFPDFVEWDSDTASERANFYNSSQIVPFISEYVLWSLLVRSPSNFEHTLEMRREQERPGQPPSSYPWIIRAKTFLNLPLIHSTKEIELERMQSTLIEITKEGEIMKKIQRMSNIRDIEIEQSKKAFEKGIQKLVKEVDDRHDDYVLKGKCKKCKD